MVERAITYFVGEFTHSLDTKGRLTIPSKWRIPGGDNTYLALPNQDGYITVYPPKMVARLEENMGDAKLSGVRRRALSMELFSAPIRSGATSREDQLESRPVASRRNQGEGGLGGEFHGFLDLVGGSLRQAEEVE